MVPVTIAPTTRHAGLLPRDTGDEREYDMDKMFIKFMLSMTAMILILLFGDTFFPSTPFGLPRGTYVILQLTLLAAFCRLIKIIDLAKAIFTDLLSLYVSYRLEKETALNQWNHETID